LLANLHPDRTQASLFDVAYSVAQLASMAMTVGLSGVMFATFSRLAVENQQKMDRFYEFSIRIISLLTVPVFCFIIANAESVLHVLYSSPYATAAPVIVGIVAFRVVARLFGGPENAEYLLSRGKVGTVVSLGIASAGVNVILNVLLIPRLGALGSVIAGGTASILASMLAAFAVFKMSPNRLQFLFWLKLTLASVVASAVQRMVVSGNDVQAIVVGALVFLVLLILSLVLIKPLTAGDAEWLSLVNKKFERALGLLTASPSEVAQTGPTTP
jgi:O-antigen/teichoic acid export membrane protein